MYPDFQLDQPFELGKTAWGAGCVYPPPAALLGVPFVFLGEPLGFAAFTTIAGMALGSVVYAIGRREGLGGRGAALLMAGILCSGPAIESLMTGQANTLVAVGLGLAWLFPRTSGYLAVTGGFLKVFPILMLSWAARVRAPMFGPVVLGAGIAVTSLVVFGFDSWLDFARTLANGRHGSPVFPVPPRHYLDPIIGTTLSTWATYLHLRRDAPCLAALPELVCRVLRGVLCQWGDHHVGA